MAATKDSKARVGQTLAEYVARGLFDASHGADPVLEEGDPDGLLQDIHVFSQLWFSQDDHDDLDEAIAELPLEFFDFEYDAAEWHRHYTPPEIYARAHILRLAHGWEGAKKLHDHLRQNPMLIPALGLTRLPDQSTLHRAWEKFSPEHRQALRLAAREVVHMARYYDIPAPARAFQPEQERERRTRKVSTRQLTIERTEEVWEHASPHICEEFRLLRGDNWSIPEVRYWQQHAYAGLKGKYVNTAARGSAGAAVAGDGVRLLAAHYRRRVPHVRGGTFQPGHATSSRRARRCLSAGLLRVLRFWRVTTPFGSTSILG